MDFKGYRVKIIIIVLILTIALLVGGAMLFDRTMVQRPLASVLDERDQIREHDTFTRNGVTTVMIRLGDIEDWPVFYRSLGVDIKEVLGERPFQLEIEDSRDEVLTQAYGRMHYALQEAAVKGNFVMMAELVDHIAQELELDDYQLQVDEENIFVKLRHENFRLYEVVGRMPEGSDS